MQPSAPVDLLPCLLTYLAFASFAITVVARLAMWLRLPMHLRWELYPIPHAPMGKARYGGSLMEEAEWWKQQPRRPSPLGMVKATIPEMVFLSSVRTHNRQLWRRTFPFHLGIYLVGTAVGLALLVGAATAIAPQASAGSVGRLVQETVLIVGVAGLALGSLGALSLLLRRLTVPALRLHTVPGDIFNLAFFALTFGCGLLTFLLVDRHADRAMAFAATLTSFHLAALPGHGIERILPTTTVVLSGLLVAYIPLTHMSHFVGKYFAFHAIRWNDASNLAGGPQEDKIEKLLAYRVSWRAEHIQGEGRKNWSDLALENPARSLR